MNKQTDKPILLFNIYGEQFNSGFAGNVWDKEGISPALMTMGGGNRQPMIIESEDMTNNLTPPLKQEMGMRRKKNYPNDNRRLHPCNHGDIRICVVCQYNFDCPFSEGGSDRDRTLWKRKQQEVNDSQR